MLRPKTFLLAAGILLLALGGIFYLLHTDSFFQMQQKVSRQLDAYTQKPRNVTAIFLDITRSDTDNVWAQKPFREQFIKALNTYLTSDHDVVAVYLLHGDTRDVQPFWTNYPLSAPPAKERGDSAAVILSGIEKQHCMEVFDSLVSRLRLLKWVETDSMLMEFTDVFGAFQQAALYFRAFATSPKDHKRVFLLSDVRENAGISDGDIKLNSLGSIETARSLASTAAGQLRRATDIGDALRFADVYILTPNNRLYYNNERNLRRICWEDLLIKKLHCNSVNFF
jgi:hypothetical protein